MRCFSRIGLAAVGLLLGGCDGCRARSTKVEVTLDGAIPDPDVMLREVARPELTAFASSAELEAFLAQLAALQQADDLKEGGNGSEPLAATSIGNPQTAGVEEGDIVKAHGKHLVVLRRGRLFSIAIGEARAPELRAVMHIDAFAQGIETYRSRYDELLVHGDTVVVLGHSRAYRATEINLFSIDAAGALSLRSTYHLRSNDTAPSKQVSRLIGDQLVFYTPRYLRVEPTDLYDSMPSLRRWRGDANDEPRLTFTPQDVYRPLQDTDFGTLHTLTRCALPKGDAEMRCHSRAVFGLPAFASYVSTNAVYVWSRPYRGRPAGDERPNSVLFRLPLGDEAPALLRVRGEPLDRFSFLESGGSLYAALIGDPNGDAIWSRADAGLVSALLRVPLSQLSKSAEAPLESYLPLPTLPGYYASQNRFVGDFLLLGAGSGQNATGLFAVRYAAPTLQSTNIDPKHAIERIEPIGKDAIVVGPRDKDLVLTPVQLQAEPRLDDPYVRVDTQQGERHGFLSSAHLIGMPILGEHARMLWIKNSALHLTELGTLTAQPAPVDDHCQVSCADGYGDARPIFLRDRVFALLGYELIEVGLDHDQVTELRRVSFAP